MFTADKIAEANGQVKTGADFPRLAQELREMGVLFNDVYVFDGHAEYLGDSSTIIKMPPMRTDQSIADEFDSGVFDRQLKIHQSGGTDYPTFLDDCAHAGVSMWRIDLTAMTCTYFDSDSNSVLVERIASV